MIFPLKFIMLPHLKNLMRKHGEHLLHVAEELHVNPDELKEFVGKNQKYLNLLR